MICTGNYFNPKGHRGKIFSISCSEPKGYKIDGKLDFFAPSQSLLEWWKKSQQTQADWQQYTETYRQELASNKIKIFDWVKQFSQFGKQESEDCTLLCWEKAGAFCHRHLVREFVIQKYCPLYDGGESPGELEMGAIVDWPWMPDYLLNYVNLPLKVRAISAETVRLSQIDKDIAKCFVRNYE